MPHSTLHAPAATGRPDESLPGPGPGRRAKLNELIQNEQWHEAAAAYDATLADSPSDTLIWYDCACMHVRIGDLDGYRNVCVRMHARFGKSDGWNENAHLAHACCLAPKALADLTTPRQHAEKRLALTPNTKIPWIHHMLGLAHYRAGEYEQAVLRIKKCQRENPRWPINMVNELLLAMAQHQLKRDDEARSHLEIAKAAIRAVLSGNPPSHKGFAPKGWHWRDWLTVELLHREASDLVSK